MVLSTAVPIDPPICWLVLTRAPAIPASADSLPLSRRSSRRHDRAHPETDQHDERQDVRGVAGVPADPRKPDHAHEPSVMPTGMRRRGPMRGSRTMLERLDIRTMHATIGRTQARHDRAEPLDQLQVVGQEQEQSEHAHASPGAPRIVGGAPGAITGRSAVAAAGGRTRAARERTSTAARRRRSGTRHRAANPAVRLGPGKPEHDGKEAGQAKAAPGSVDVRAAGRRTDAHVQGQRAGDGDEREDRC